MIKQLPRMPSTTRLRELSRSNRVLHTEYLSCSAPADHKYENSNQNSTECSLTRDECPSKLRGRVWLEILKSERRECERAEVQSVDGTLNKSAAPIQNDIEEITLLRPGQLRVAVQGGEFLLLRERK